MDIRRTIFIIAFPLLVFAAVLAIGRRPHAETTPHGNGQPVDIPAPTNWIPFSATLEHRNEGATAIGRYYRRPDGSTCSVLDGRLGRTIHINDVKTRSAYNFVPSRGWVSRPMMIPDGIYRPRVKFLEFLSRRDCLAGRKPYQVLGHRSRSAAGRSQLYDSIAGTDYGSDRDARRYRAASKAEGVKVATPRDTH